MQSATALAGNPQGLAARGEHTESFAAAEERDAELGRRRSDVLAVVEDQERLLRTEVLADAVERRHALTPRRAHHIRNRAGDEL